MSKAMSYNPPIRAGGVQHVSLAVDAVLPDADEVYPEEGNFGLNDPIKDTILQEVDNLQRQLENAEQELQSLRLEKEWTQKVLDEDGGIPPELTEVLETIRSGDKTDLALIAPHIEGEWRAGPPPGDGKPRFIIGRGNGSVSLAIPDGSGRFWHALVMGPQGSTAHAYMKTEVKMWWATPVEMPKPPGKSNG